MTDLERVRELARDGRGEVMTAYPPDWLISREGIEAHLKEDAVRDRTAEYNFLEAEKVPKLQAELAELREAAKALLWTLENTRSTLLGKSAAGAVDRLRQLIEEKPPYDPGPGSEWERGPNMKDVG